MLFPILTLFFSFVIFFEPSLGQEPAAAQVRPPRCPANETYRSCATRCEPTCGVKPGPCVKICDPPKCQCSTGYTRDNSTGRCVLPADCTSQDGQPTNPCAAVLCIQGTTCVVKGGRARCVKGGSNVDVCAGVECPPGQDCVPQTVQCVRAPCPPVPECKDVCADVKCPEGQSCKRVQVQCFAPPCPPIGECVPDQEGSSSDRDNSAD